MATDDLKARLLAEADYCEEMHGLTGAPDVMREAADAIEALEAQLAARDAVWIAAFIAAFNEHGDALGKPPMTMEEQRALLEITRRARNLSATAINRKDEA